jgi:glucose-fructose oxidoreductase
VAGKTRRHRFARHDQFAAELLYFSDCILHDKEPEPSGIEGLIDVHIVRSLYESARTGLPVKPRELTRQRRPTARQEINRPPVGIREEIRAEAPSRN